MLGRDGWRTACKVTDWCHIAQEILHMSRGCGAGGDELGEGTSQSGGGSQGHCTAQGCAGEGAAGPRSGGCEAGCSTAGSGHASRSCIKCNTPAQAQPRCLSTHDAIFYTSQQYSLTRYDAQVLAKQSEPLCWGCFDDDIRRLVRKAVRLKGLIRPGDRVLAAVSGGMVLCQSQHVHTQACMRINNDVLSLACRGGLPGFGAPPRGPVQHQPQPSRAGTGGLPAPHLGPASEAFFSACLLSFPINHDLSI